MSERDSAYSDKERFSTMVDEISAVIEVKMSVPWQDAEPAAKAIAEMFSEFAAKRLGVFDEAVAMELPRISTLEYNSREICEHFAGQLRARLIRSRYPLPAPPEA